MLKKEQIEHARLRALAQAIVSKEKGKEVFEKQKKQTHGDVIKALNAEVSRGSLGIKPLWQAKTQGRHKTRTVEKAAAPSTPESREKRGTFYTKLGKMMPT